MISKNQKIKQIIDILEILLTLAYDEEIVTSSIESIIEDLKEIIDENDK